MEARVALSEYLQDGWDRIVSDPGLVDLFIKDRNGEALTESEEFRLSAYWMGFLIRREFQFHHFPDSTMMRNVFERIYAGYGSFRRTWEGNTEGSRNAGKHNFSPEFIGFVDKMISAEAKGPERRVPAEDQE